MLPTADRLNADCTCISLDREALARELDGTIGDGNFAQRLAETHPNLLSNLPVFLRPDHLAEMAAIIKAVETVARTPAYEEAALEHAPAIARHATGAIGVFMGYDFHLGEDGPKLIEINTNAGGALINAVLAQAQKACCAPVAALFLLCDEDEQSTETKFLESFLQEWRNVRGDAPLRSIAIVDTEPERQYLYPEFQLFKRLFERHGLRALIAAPEQLELRGSALKCRGQSIDLVYNRLTDFCLASPECTALREAYLSGHVVLTPNPWSHAIFADKRNLVRLSDQTLLARWQVSDEVIKRLARGIPRTTEVTPQSAAALWTQRSSLFFKPATGFASRAAYRGDKVTRKVWDTICGGGYVAQALVPPSTRTVLIDGARQTLKVDIRNYTYAGEVQLIAARLYQGQTTNMRTMGGGFAPVLAGATPDMFSCCIPGGGACESNFASQRK